MKIINSPLRIFASPSRPLRLKIIGNSMTADNVRMEAILAERQRYLNGEGKSYSWEELKTMILNRQRPDNL